MKMKSHYHMSWYSLTCCVSWTLNTLVLVGSDLWICRNGGKSKEVVDTLLYTLPKCSWWMWANSFPTNLHPLVSTMICPVYNTLASPPCIIPRTCVTYVQWGSSWLDCLPAILVTRTWHNACDMCTIALKAPSNLLSQVFPLCFHSVVYIFTSNCYNLPNWLN